MAWPAFPGKGALSVCFSALLTLGCGDTVHTQPKLTPVEGEPVGECAAVLRTYDEGATRAT